MEPNPENKRDYRYGKKNKVLLSRQRKTRKATISNISKYWAKKNQEQVHSMKALPAQPCVSKDGTHAPARSTQDRPNDQMCIFEDLLRVPFAKRPMKERKMLMSQGKPTPGLPNLMTVKTDICMRKFNDVKWFNEVFWLSGSVKQNKLFCWPCSLFNFSLNVWNKNGFDDLNNMSKAMKRHEVSHSHLASVLKYNSFGKKRIDCSLNKKRYTDILKHNKSVSNNLKVLERLIRVVCYQEPLEVATRGPEKILSDIRANFNDLVGFLRDGTLLQNRVQGSSMFWGLSDNMREEIIKSVSTVMTEEIKREIKEAQFVSISLLETSDLTNKSQLATVARYVGTFGTVEERFLHFTDVSWDRSANALADHLHRVLAEYECAEKLVDQTYNGAAVVAGDSNLFQTRFEQTSPDALLVNCVAYRLNLALSRAVSNIKDCHIFFKTLTSFSSFFGGNSSSKRHRAIEEEVRKWIPNVVQERWSLHRRLMGTIIENEQQVKNLLERMIASPDDWDDETFNGARRYLAYFKTFDCNFLLAIFSEIFSLMDALVHIMQATNYDILQCVTKINEFQEVLTKKGQEFDRFWAKSTGMAEENPGRKRFRLDKTKGDLKTGYRSLLSEIINNVNEQLTIRFKDFWKMKCLELINPSKCATANPVYVARFPEEAFKNLKICHGNHFDLPNLKNELISMYQSKDLNQHGVEKLHEYFVSARLEKAYPQLVKLCQLILTMPATSTSTERPLDAFKRIETHSRNSTCREELPELAMLSIEKRLLDSLIENDRSFFDRVMALFRKNVNRRELIFR